jgi:heterodisulfide reductase subunit C
MTRTDDDLARRLRAVLLAASVDGCIQCGRCTATCPAALPAPLRAREVVRAVQEGDGSVVDREDIWHCTTCFSCQERCPKGVLITQAVLWLRAEAVRRGRYPAPHTTALAEIARTGNTFPLDNEVRKVRGQLSLPLDPPDCAHDDDELAAYHRLLVVIGLDDLVPTRRPWPGEGTEEVEEVEEAEEVEEVEEAEEADGGEGG